MSTAPESLPTPATLTYDEAAAYLGIGRRSLERLVAAGTVRHLRPMGGVRVLFRRADLDAYLDRTARGGEPRKGRRS